MPTDGGGAYGVGPTAGVVGAYRGTNADTRAGGAFAVRDGSGTYNWVYVAGQQVGNARKIHGSGTASTTIRDATTGEYHILFCPEAPEALFWDQGTYFLSTQRAFIPFDALLAQHLAPPYAVHVQPWGPLQVAVTTITDEGFWVEAEATPPSPIRLSYLIQGRQKAANERLPQVHPHRYFTPFQPVQTYLTPNQLFSEPPSSK